MPSSFPGAIDNFTDPLAGSPLNSPSHSGQHSDLNDAVEKIETYMGLVKVIPTGATNGTVAANGTVTVGNAVPSVTVSGAFSSRYKNYKIVWNNGAGSGFADLALSLGGITTGYYGAQFGASYVSGGFGGRGVNNAASWLYAGSCNNLFAFFHCDVLAPQAAERKLCHGYASYHGAAFAYSMFTGEVTSSAQATSFTITPSAGTITGGTIRIYGYGD